MHETAGCKKGIGIRFRVFREIIDRTHEQLAKELAAALSEIKDIENGKIFPGILCLHWLHEEYGLNINWLMTGIGGMFNDKDPKKLGALISASSSLRSRSARLCQYMELVDLLEIPVVEASIMATLLEIKTLLKLQSRETGDAERGETRQRYRKMEKKLC